MREPQASDHGQRWGAAVLRRRREALGLTREALSRATRVAASTIRNLERGRVARPEPMTLRLLCGALSLPMPGDEGLYLSLDGVPADRLSQVACAALDEYALRRRDPRRFIAAVAPGQAAQQVTADRDLALRLRDLLRGVEDFSCDEPARTRAATRRCTAPGDRP